MKIVQAIEGSLIGIPTLSLLQETLHKVDSKAPQASLHPSKIWKKLKKKKGKRDAQKLYVQLAGELLSGAAYFGWKGLGKKKTALLKGGLLGAAAGLGSVLLSDDFEIEESGKIIYPGTKEKALTVALYTAGGLLAGATVKKGKK